MFTEFGKAADEDELGGTINYEEVYAIISGIMSTNAKLLEHLAHKINVEILNKFATVRKVIVKVSKHNPPLKGICRAASVTLEATR